MFLLLERNSIFTKGPIHNFFCATVFPVSSSVSIVDQVENLWVEFFGRKVNIEYFEN